MGSSMVRYKVKPGRAEENEALVKAVYEQLGRERPAGLHYATFRLPDGVSFMHIVFETDQPGRILGEVAAFAAFTAEIESRCEEPPVGVGGDAGRLVRHGSLTSDRSETRSAPTVPSGPIEWSVRAVRLGWQRCPVRVTDHAGVELHAGRPDPA